MKYIQRGEVIKMIRAAAPSVSENTLKIYIDDGVIKHSSWNKKRGYKLFSVPYIQKVIGCIKTTIDWKMVREIKL